MSSVAAEGPLRSGSAVSIPMVDIGPLSDIHSPGAHRVAEEMAKACEDIGFMYIENHGVPEDLIDEVFAQSRAFHESPPELKQTISVNEFHRGYLGMNASTIVTSSVAKVTKPNPSESLVFLPQLAEDHPDVLAGKPLRGPNQWPSWLPGFRESVDAYYEAVQAVARRLLEGFAIALDLPHNHFASSFQEPTAMLRLLRYPPMRPDDEFSAAPHTDYGCITVLAVDGVGGLQVKPRSKDWIEAPNIPGTFIVNIGNMMQRWTNDRFSSTPHQVLNKSQHYRFAIPLFFDPDMDAVIECLPTCHSADGTSRYPPLHYGDYFLDALDRTYAYRQSKRSQSS